MTSNDCTHGAAACQHSLHLCRLVTKPTTAVAGVSCPAVHTETTEIQPRSEPTSCAGEAQADRVRSLGVLVRAVSTLWVVWPYLTPQSWARRHCVNRAHAPTYHRADVGTCRRSGVVLRLSACGREHGAGQPRKQRRAYHCSNDRVRVALQRVLCADASSSCLPHAAAGWCDGYRVVTIVRSQTV